jgi:hypothetical protein
MNRPVIGLGLLAALSLSLTACPKDKADGDDNQQVMTQSEALEAVDEASVSAQASDLTAASVEISTNFTIGGAVERAAEELRTFVGSQLPCAEITLTGATLHVTYGKKPGNCLYRGHTFFGETELTVARNDDGDVEVDHTWTDFSNGKLKVSGTAKVTWSLANKSRHVVHQLTWTRLSDGKTGVGTGDRTQTALNGDVKVGIREDGNRSWEGQRGRWDLSIQGVEMRWADPVPQAGSFVLATPKDKSVTLSFARVDADTIRVTLTGGRGSFSFNVNSLGIKSSS